MKVVASLKKRTFTLVEMMIVLALLLVVGGALAFNSRSAIDQARFRGDVRGIQSILKSVDEALVVGYDPFLTFEKKEGTLHLSYQEAMGRFKRKEFTFPAIGKVFLNDQEVTAPLFFGDRGAIYPQGILYLIGAAGTEKIELKTPFIKEMAQQNSYPEWIREVCKKKEEMLPKKGGATSS